MSVDEQEPTSPAKGAPEESGRPSVRLTRNAKGEVQIDVKAYGGDDAIGLAEAGMAAEAEFNRLAGLYPLKRS